MTVGPGDDFELTMDELRVVARYVAESAQEVLPVFEDANPGDPRPRAAVGAAWEFVNGARRTKLQRVTSLDAHRAAKEAATEPHVSLHAPPAMPHLPLSSTPLRKLPR